MRNEVRVWTVTGVLFVAACLRTTTTFLDYPDRSNLATLQWSFIALWLLLTPIAVWRQWRAMRAHDEILARDTAVRIAIFGFVPIALVMGLIDRLR